ncbi:hypothetical protein CMI48_03790 [Candidatus Pacearchaeota archaeon]|nr:hypothetical protein [Candidatus Pacearchaeota archaeon]
MAKKLLLGILAAVLLIAFLAYTSLTSSTTVEAQLYLEEGSVLVNNQPIQETTQLREGDTITTEADGLATIILYESVTISLNPNTKITVEELTQQHPKLAQEGGETFNTFANIAGVESYSISAGNSLATVRGTTFSLTEEKIITTEGEVEYTRDRETFTVRKDEVVERIAQKTAKRQITQLEKIIIKKQEERTIKQLQALREREIEKNSLLKKAVTSQLDINDEELYQHLRDVDNSGQDVDTLVEKSPVKSESLEKIAKITKEIQRKKMALSQQQEGIESHKTKGLTRRDQTR